MMIRPVRGVLFAAITAALVASAAMPATASTAAASARRYPAVVAGHADTLHPEGATWDTEHHRFLVGSMRHGTVSAVRPDGSVSTLVDDPQVLVSVIGLHVDTARGRVLVANADTGAGLRTSAGTVHRLAGVGAYDLATGQRLFYVDLSAVAGDGGPHFANDLAFGPDGTAYVTDSFAPIVYRVGTDGSASVLVRDSRLAAPAGAFGLNGIVRQGGWLVLGKYDDGTLWRVRIDRPTELAQVAVTGDAAALVGLDGMLRRSDGTVLGVTNRLGGNGRDAELELRSDDSWHTARITEDHPSPDPVPTALTPGPAGSVYQLSGRLDLLFAGTPSDAFTLHRV